MEETFSTDFKKFFLLLFTRELIRHSAKGEIIELEQVIKLQAQEKKEKFMSSIMHEMNQPKEITDLKKSSYTGFYKPTRQMPVSGMHLYIPEPQLPPHLQYLRPTPTEMEIDLWKINPLVKDPAVRVIECNGPDEHIVVSGAMGTKPTDIILSKEDISRIINRFSEVSKIPVSEGVYRIVVGRLNLSAIISEVIGSKFIIKKMAYASVIPSSLSTTQARR